MNPLCNLSTLFLILFYSFGIESLPLDLNISHVETNLTTQIPTSHIFNLTIKCNEGYVVSSNGTCILSSECSSSEKKACPKNSHIVPCGSPCAPTCDNPSPTICTVQCIVDACTCDDGYVLDSQNNCIKPENCPKKQKICGENEKFFICGTHCEANCDVPFPGFCSDKCLENACQCEFGFVRNEQGKCVLLSECLV
uniref:TIL domain-containing protein n=1 Tax=Panagrolaimus sp. JU765 TaxID=591449 RepID=A0AC34PUY4_9BILA